MKASERLNKILLASCNRIQEEVASLIGKPFSLGEPQFRQTTKEEIFTEPGGKQVLAHIRVDGEIQGAGCLLVGIKAAIHIGGTLIMLPESELESVSVAEEYSEELQDSFGEVANIICGAVTLTFEEQFPQNVRFIRTEQEVVVPIKVVAASEKPIADGPYYVMSAAMQMGDRELGGLDVILPAVPFGLVVAGAVKENTAMDEATTSALSETKGKAEPVQAVEEVASGGKDGEVAVAQEPAEAEQEAGQPVHPQRDLDKQKKLVDKLLNNSMAKMSEEVSALLGGTLQIVPTEHLALTKKDFLEQAGGKQIMTRMEIRGEGHGEAFLFVDVKTAVYLGGALIMLPEGELAEAVRNEEFGEDASDAYGEVTNIIAGVYSGIFEEQYHTKLGFVKASIEPIVPVKIDSESDQVIPNQAYYLSLGQILYHGKDLGRLQIVIPARVLELEALLGLEESTVANDAVGDNPQKTTGKDAGLPASEPARLQEKPSATSDILIFTDDDNEANSIAAALRQVGYIPHVLHFKDSVNSVLTPRIQMIFLVMQEVSEQGFGMAIKISSSGRSVPLVAAGPAWTRTLVLKAVKYGACDILITPSSTVDVHEKIEVNLVKRAA